MSQPADPASELKNKFLKCEASVNESKVQVPESLKYKLYGLAKQVVVGDCKMPQPPASNEILRAKWDGWTACTGMAVEQAMKEYISIVDGLEPGVKAPLEKRLSTKNLLAEAPGGIKRKGRLFKQRDHFKGWRPRHFVLQDCFLHYYLEADDPVPRATLDLTGCSVTSSKAVFVDGVEYFPFTISHPRSKATYHLSSDSKLDADMWVAKILEVATASGYSAAAGTSDSVVGGTGNTAEEVSTGSSSYAVTKLTDHFHDTRSYLSSDLMPKLERLAQQVLDSLDSSAPGWDPLLDKSGVVAKKKTSPGQIHIKAEINLPYCLFDVFALLTDISRQKEIDPSRAVHERVQDISMHAWVDYIQAKGIWPTSPRDFVNFANWRLLTNGSVMLLSFSDPLYSEMRPAKEGIVRGEMLLAGFLLTPQPEGTKLGYVLHLDLKGSIPNTVVGLAASSQAMLLANIKKVLDGDKKKNPASLKSPSYMTNYSELVSLMAADRDGGSSEKAGSSNAPNSTSGKSIPPHRRAVMVKLANRSMKIGKLSMIVLLLPTLLYYAVESRFRAAAFLAGILISYHYLLRRHLGKPEAKVAKHFSLQMPSGRLVTRFPVQIGRLLVYLDNKRADSELEVTFTHVVVKACALILLEMPSLNGHVIASSFFRAKTLGVDMSVSIDVSSKETVSFKICDADAKPLECVADELIQASKTLRDGGEVDKGSAFFSKLDSYLPAVAAGGIKRLLYNLGAMFGISIPSLGVVPYPLGVCSVINSPNLEKEEDMDMTVISDGGDAFAPITVTMSGMRIVPSVNENKSVSGTPVLNFSVAMSTYAASMTEMRRFCMRLQELLNDPTQIDKLHLKADFDRQEGAKRRMFFGKNGNN